LVLRYNQQVMKFRRYMNLIVLALLLGALQPPMAGQPAGNAAGALALVQATRTPRPTVIHPTRRATQTASLTPTATRTPFRPLPATATRRPSPTPVRPNPTPILPTTASAAALPDSARIEGLIGFGQSLPLSCESRSAVDWARFFGAEIAELVFFNRLQRSADPEIGFVGSPYGVWGQIPPYDYGVHAEPVAQLLREYGLPAGAARHLALTEALAEIAAGRPVVVWVTGHVEPGRGVEITINEQVRRVARYEHTVILIGYDDNRDILTFQDGAKVYERSVAVFLQAWEPLENMAVVWEGD
jgi:uncharacterized protein YvpB